MNRSVFILESRDSSFYISIRTNLEQPLEKHISPQEIK